MTSWGTGPWGTGSWGIASALTIEYAYAISTHEVVVRLSKPPKDVFHLLNGDVRNANSWRVSIPGTPLRYLQVAEVVPKNLPLEWIVRTVQFLPDSTFTARVEGVTLLDASGNVMGMPSYADFAGVTEKATSTPTELAVFRNTGSRDLLNNPAPPIGGVGTNLSGTLVMKGGDYALMEGAALARKLIVRRLTTTPTDFFHLPNYGVGIKVKQPIPGGGLVRFKALVERELMKERDLASVNVTVSQSQNTLSIQVRAVLAKTGQQVSIGLASPIG